MKKLSSLTELQSKEKSSSPSSIGVEFSQFSTVNYYLYYAFLSQPQKIVKTNQVRMGSNG